MKPYQCQSPYFNKRNSFQSPQCSSVMQVTPNILSEQSMLQKIIYPNLHPHPSQQNYRSKYSQEYQYNHKSPLKQKHQNYKASPYKENNMKIQSNYNKQYDFNKKKYNQEQIPQKSYKQNDNIYRRNSIDNDFSQIRIKKNIIKNKENYNNHIQNNNQNYDKKYQQKQKRFQNTERYKENIDVPYNRKFYDNQCPNDNIKRYSQSVEINKKYKINNDTKSRQNYDEVTPFDQQRLRKIQDKIKQYNTNTGYNSITTRQNQSQKYQAPSSSKKISLRQCLQHEQYKRSPLKNNHKGLQRDYSKGKYKKENMYNLLQRKQIQEYQTKLQKQNRQKRQQNSLQKRDSYIIDNLKDEIKKIFSIVTQNPKGCISYENLNLKNIQNQDVKIILGPIFTQIRIKNKIYQLDQFIKDSIELLSKFKNDELEKIWKSFRSIDRVQINVSFRAPGKLLSNSKAQLKGVRRHSVNEQIYLSSKQPIQNLENTDTIRYHKYKQNQLFSKGRNQPNYETKKIFSKKVYMQPTQKDQSPANINKNEFYYNKESQKNPETILNSQKEKRKYVETKRQSVNLRDDELQRLQSLQIRFKQHFRQKN